MANLPDRGIGKVRRHFAVAVFVVSQSRVLLLFHRKLRMWLPPGGHVDADEIPDDSAVREVWEETGVRVELVGVRGLDLAYPRQLVRPEGVQVERIDDEHEHIDFVYFARPADGEPLPPVYANAQECEGAGWYALDELEALGTNAEMRAWAERAVRVVSGRAR